jgi:large subunit ribosomal protein L32
MGWSAVALVRSPIAPVAPAGKYGERETMAVPKRRHSNARTNSRRANHDKKEPRHITYCQQCSSPVPPHTVCPKCGHYMGRKVMDVE